MISDEQDSKRALEISQLHVSDYFNEFKRIYNSQETDRLKKMLIKQTACFFIFGLDELINKYPPEDIKFIIDGLRLLANTFEKRSR